MADIVDLMKKAFLAGVGAAAEGTEKADQLLKDMIKKGEITVEQGIIWIKGFTRRNRRMPARMFPPS